MVNKLSLEKVGVKGEKREGVAYVADYSKKMSEKTGKTHIAGILKNKTDIMSFKVWQEKIPEFEAAVENSRIVNFTGILDDFGGTISITLSNADAYEGPFGIADFVEGLDETKLECEFWELITNNCDKETTEILKLLFSTPYVKERFFKEFAGKVMHDALPGGLANHTIKMMKLFLAVTNLYDFWDENKSLMIAAIALHDVGKIYELNDGSYTKNSFITHIDECLEQLLYPNKKEIIALKGEDFYNYLKNAVKGHMNQFESLANTVYAMAIHMIDNLEAWLTKASHSAKFEFTELANGDKVIGKGADTLYI